VDRYVADEKSSQKLDWQQEKGFEILLVNSKEERVPLHVKLHV
jgi:hypothetical protein